MAPFDNHIQIPIGIPYASNHGHISYHFRDKARYRFKITIFHTPLAFDSLVRVVVHIGILP